MIVVVELAPGAQRRPPPGSPIVVQARDVTYADAPTPIVAQARGTVGEAPSSRLAAVELELPWHAPPRLELWAHVDVDDDTRVSLGDFVTTSAHPITESDAGVPHRVVVKPV
jgi:uncharacterized lipoprotein YbaY